MGQNDFAAWMDKQMAFYREQRIPFIGYHWHNSRTGATGGGLYRLDEVEVQAKRETFLDKATPSFYTPAQVVRPGDKLRITKTGIDAVKRIARKLEREFGTQVFIYQG